MWTTHLGCLKGCLDYLGVDISDAWLFGGTGHAFVINIHGRICPSGPTAWKTGMLFKLGRNLGYDIESIEGFKGNDNFQELQKNAWDRTRAAIDEDFPCYGWELDIPEYYVIHGYDEEGYFFSGPRCDEGEGPKPWRELGDTGIGVIEMYTVKPSKASDDVKTVKEVLQFAVGQAQDPDKWSFDQYKMGPDAYDLWLQAMERGIALGMGMAYNAAVWAECRAHAVQFLKEAGERIGGGCRELFDDAVHDYETVADRLKSVSELFPFMNISEAEKERNVKDGYRCRKGTECLLTAKAAEESGLRILEKLISKL